MAERKRIGVPISGLDTSTPDHSVVDGKCETLHNLRYTGEAWRNVKRFESYGYDIIDDMQPFDDAKVWKILYRHLDYFIIYVIGRVGGSEHQVYAVRYDKESGYLDSNPILISSKEFEDEDIHIADLFHFGKILHLKWNDDNEPQWYLLANGKYSLYQIDDIYFDISETFKIDSPSISEIDSPAGIKANNTQIYDYVVRAADLSNYQALLRTFSDDEAWRGSICYFLAARAEDGSILAQSPLRILSSSSGMISVYNLKGLGTYSVGGRLYGGIACGNGLEPFGDLSDSKKTEVLQSNMSPSSMYIKPTVSFSIIDSIGAFSENIFDVALYCTRIHPLFTIQSIAEALPDTPTIPTLNNYVSARVAYQKEDLPNEPFFLADKKTIAELESLSNKRTGQFILSRAVLENIESKGVVFSPEPSEHDISSTSRKEINNSLHLFGDITTKFRKVYNRNNEMATAKKPGEFGPDNQEEWSELPELKYATVFIKCQDAIFVSPLAEMQLERKSTPNFFHCGSILSYPDYRAYAMILSEWEKADSDNHCRVANYKLQAAAAINYSYYIPPISDSNIKYPLVWPYADADYDMFATNFPTSLVSKGKVWASKDNNPTALPFDRSYTIGSATNEILAINSAAIEMSDSKFGEFPVYVFTKEGIFAMQSGKETLYSAIIPINYDVIINPNTLAVNGAVLYFTDKGLHALTNQGAKLLSAPIHTTENRIPEWMYTTQMVYLPEWNEVLCTDLPNRKAYVFSLDSNVWSTRDIPEGYILNNDELVSTDDRIYNLRNEKEQGSDGIAISLTTRSIKLGSMELKRAETIIVRFECPTEQTLNVEVEGSIDTQNWKTLRKLEGVQTNKDIVIHRTPCSVKYLRFKIDGNVTDDIRILAFEVEYYNRWMRKMR